MDKINITMSIHMFSYPKDKATIKDVREWLQKVDQLGLPDDYPIEDGTLSIYFEIDPSKIESIECGSHIPPEQFNDILFVTHECNKVQTKS